MTTRTRDTEGQNETVHKANTGSRAAGAMRAGTSFVTQNAVPLALVASGATMLAVRTVNGGDNRVAHGIDTARERVAEQAGAAREDAKERARRTGERVRQGGQATSQRVRESAHRSGEVIQQNPLATGLAAMAIGAGIAVAAPRLVGRRRDTD